MHSETNADKELRVHEEQWQDFLVRSSDPYAMAKYDIVLGWLGNLFGKRALVVGCGSGELCAFLAHRGAVVTGFDIDQRSIDLAKETASMMGVDIDVSVSTLEKYPNHKTYDIVICTDVIEHIENDFAAVKKLRSLAKASGQVVITVPALQTLFGLHDEILGHFRRYNAGNLMSLVKSAGISVDRIRYYGMFLIPVTIAYSCLFRKRYPSDLGARAHNKATLFSRVIRFFFRFERYFSLGLGTSLLMVGRPEPTVSVSAKREVNFLPSAPTPTM